MSLRISPDLDLPDDFATEGVAVIGKRGSGKSNTEARFVEVLYEAGIPFAVVDPKGDWYGIKSSADGKKPGLSVPVFGGLHGDFPLEPQTGARIADLLVDEMLSAVLDVSHLSKTGGLPTFLTAFCNQLMHRHQLEPHVRTVILEEAHRYIPQQVDRKKAELKEAAASLLLEGRAFGLGCWAATQRPARLHKDVLEEVGTAVIHAIGVSATNDKKTIAGWVKHYDLNEEIVDSLTALQPGQAWVLIPQDGLVRRVQVDRRTTFDSGATPKVGQAPRRPSTMADIDAAAIKEALADVVERAKATDPTELQCRVRELEQQVAALGRQLAELDAENEHLSARPAETVAVEVPVVPARLLEALTEIEHEVKAQSGERIAALDDFRTMIEASRDYVTEIVEVARAAARGLDVRDADALAGDPAAGRRAAGDRPPAQRRVEDGRPEERPRPASRRPASRDGGAAAATADGDLTPAEREILVALAQSDDGWNGQDLAVLVGKRYSGGFRNYLSSLRTKGYIAGQNKDRMLITDTGVHAVGPYEPLPRGRSLLDWWLASDRLTPAEKDVLRQLDVHPGAVGVELAERCGKEYSGGFRNYLSKLRTMRLIEGSNSSGMRLSDLLEDR